MLREFKPVRRNQGPLNHDEISALFVNGYFKQAYRHCRETGHELTDYSAALKEMGRKMLHSRPSELAALVYRYKIDVGCDVPLILESQLKQKDYHGFLKNVHRFGLLEKFRPEVDLAIGMLRREEEVQSWRTKFKASENSTPRIAQPSTRRDKRRRGGIAREPDRTV